jgi:hypothetical protein
MTEGATLGALNEAAVFEQAQHAAGCSLTYMQRLCTFSHRIGNAPVVAAAIAGCNLDVEGASCGRQTSPGGRFQQPGSKGKESPAFTACSLAHDVTSASASLARVRFTMSVSVPSGRLIRYMPGHLVSGMMAKASSRCVTLRCFVAADTFFGSGLAQCTLEPFCEGGGGCAGVWAAELALQPVFRCAATRQVGRQKRADRRRG